MVLKEELRSTKMFRSDTIASYLNKITQVHGKLGATGETMTDEELVKVDLNDFTKPWAPFVKGIIA